MIACTFSPLTAAEDKELRVWLGKSQFDTLIKIIESRLKSQEVLFLQEAIQSGPDNDKQTAASGVLRKAQEYVHALAVLNEVANQQEPYQVAKVT